MLNFKKHWLHIMLTSGQYAAVDRFLKELHISFSVNKALHKCHLTEEALTKLLENSPEQKAIYNHFIQNKDAIFRDKMLGMGQEYIMEVFMRGGQKTKKTISKTTTNPAGEVYETEATETTISPIPTELIKMAFNGFESSSGQSSGTEMKSAEPHDETSAEEALNAAVHKMIAMGD